MCRLCGFCTCLPFSKHLKRVAARADVASLVQMLKIVSEELPSIPIYFNMAPTAYLSTLKGPTMGARVPDSRIYWDIHEWEWK